MDSENLLHSPGGQPYYLKEVSGLIQEDGRLILGFRDGKALILNDPSHRILEIDRPITPDEGGSLFPACQLVSLWATQMQGGDENGHPVGPPQWYCQLMLCEPEAG